MLVWIKPVSLLIENEKSTFSLPLVHVQCTFSACSMHLQCIIEKITLLAYLQCTLNPLSKDWSCAFSAFLFTFQCTFIAFSMHLQRIVNIPQVQISCTEDKPLVHSVFVMLNLKFQLWTYSKRMGPLFFKETIRRLRHFKNQLSERPLKMALNDPWKCFQAPTSALYEVSFNSICGTCLAASLECHQHVFFPLQQGKNEGHILLL